MQPFFLSGKSNRDQMSENGCSRKRGGQERAPIDVEDVVEDGVPGLAVKVEVGVLCQVHWGGFIGGGLNHALQLVVVAESVGDCSVQIARKALQKAQHTDH